MQEVNKQAKGEGPRITMSAAVTSYIRKAKAGRCADDAVRLEVLLHSASLSTHGYGHTIHLKEPSISLPLYFTNSSSSRTRQRHNGFFKKKLITQVKHLMPETLKLVRDQWDMLITSTNAGQEYPKRQEWKPYQDWNSGRFLHSEPGRPTQRSCAHTIPTEAPGKQSPMLLLKDCDHCCQLC